MANIAIIMAITLTMDACGMIQYFGGDPEGSIFMLAVPSVLFYYLFGAACLLLGRLFRNRQ